MGIIFSIGQCRTQAQTIGLQQRFLHPMSPRTNHSTATLTNFYPSLSPLWGSPWSSDLEQTTSNRSRGQQCLDDATPDFQVRGVLDAVSACVGCWPSTHETVTMAMEMSPYEGFPHGRTLPTEPGSWANVEKPRANPWGRSRKLKRLR